MGSREHGVAYNRLICGLRTADIDLEPQGPRGPRADRASFAAVVATVRRTTPTAMRNRETGRAPRRPRGAVPRFYDQRGSSDDIWRTSARRRCGRAMGRSSCCGDTCRACVFPSAHVTRAELVSYMSLAGFGFVDLAAFWLDSAALFRVFRTPVLACTNAVPSNDSRRQHGLVVATAPPYDHAAQRIIHRWCSSLRASTQDKAGALPHG